MSIFVQAKMIYRAAMVGSTLRAVFGAFVFAMSTFACSDDGSGQEEVESGTCNGLATGYLCVEVKGDADDVEFEKESCMGFNDTWTTEPCPSENIIGCCRYTFSGADYRECRYVGDPETMPEEACAFWDGTWTLGP